MDNFDNIQEIWNRLNERLERLEPSIIDQSKLVAENNIKSARKRLLQRTKVLITLNILCIFFFPVYFWIIPASETGFAALDTGHWRVTLCLCNLLYFLTGLVLTTLQFLKIQDINPGTMSIEEISRNVRSIKKCHLISECVMIFLAIIYLVIFFYFLSFGERYLMVAAMIGGFIGLGFAIPMFFKYMGDYRKMIYPYDDSAL